MYQLTVADVVPHLTDVDPSESLVSWWPAENIFSVKVQCGHQRSDAPPDLWYEAKNLDVAIDGMKIRNVTIPLWTGFGVCSLLVHETAKLQWVQLTIGGSRFLRLDALLLRAFTRRDGALDLMSFLRHLDIPEYHLVCLQAYGDLDVTVKLRKKTTVEPFTWTFYQVQPEQSCTLCGETTSVVVRPDWNGVVVGILCVVEDIEGTWRGDCVKSFRLHTHTHNNLAPISSRELPGWAAVVGSAGSRSAAEVVDGLQIHSPHCYYLPVDDTINFSRCDYFELHVTWSKPLRYGRLRCVAINKNWVHRIGGMAGTLFVL